MSPQDAAGASEWREASLAACVLAVDPAALGGVVVAPGYGPVAERWLEGFAARLARGAPVSRAPLNVDDSRLLGGLDLAATLAAGRPMVQSGLLAQADGGVLVLSMAECRRAADLARLTGALDRGEVTIERDGAQRTERARLGVIALHGGDPVADPLAAILDERLALRVALSAIRDREALSFPFDPAAVAGARERAPTVGVPSDVYEQVALIAASFGVGSIRPLIYTVRAARFVAALEEAATVGEDHVLQACRLVLVPRALCAPGADDAAEGSEATEGNQATEADEANKADDPAGAPQNAQRSEAREEPELQPTPERDESAAAEPDAAQLKTSDASERLVAAAQALLPAGLLAAMQNGNAARRAVGGGGRFSAQRVAGLRGRPLPARAGAPGKGARLDLVATLRAAAPWQRVRAAARPDDVTARVQVRHGDLKVRQRAQCPSSAILFVVDASGSSAAHRLGEAKGAVQLLLADCYVRRDRVGLISFRGQGAEVVLEPTRSLARAKRSLAALPGGGATPLASAIDAVVAQVGRIEKRGETPVVVFLTDARANVARDGTQGRERANADAHQAARLLRQRRAATLLVDTGLRTSAQAESLAATLGARYLALPQGGATRLSEAVRSVADHAVEARSS